MTAILTPLVIASKLFQKKSIVIPWGAPYCPALRLAHIMRISGKGLLSPGGQDRALEPLLLALEVDDRPVLLGKGRAQNWIRSRNSRSFFDGLSHQAALAANCFKSVSICS